MITPKLLVIGAIIIGILVFLLVQPSSKTSSHQEMKVGDTTIRVTVMRTPEELAQGLSGKEKLEEDEGMFFILPTTQIPTFWMKDMNFAIDMIWIKDTIVVGVTENVSTPGKAANLKDLPRYSPTDSANRVLEVNAGFSQKHNIKKGSIIQIQ